MANSRKSPIPNKPDARLIDRFERALEGILARVVVSAGDAIAVAYSGGLDSSVLLQLAAHYCRRHDRLLHAYHVHHGLSPNADAWLDHCRQQAVKAGASFDAVRVSLSRADGEGVEQAARQARYDTLGKLCRRDRVRLLLTAHHQDDQAETVLLQLFRGTGLRGLGGMAELNDAHTLLGTGVALGRPLLDCSRRELEDAAAALGLDPVADESNADTRYRRNAIRHEIVPAIARHFPGCAATLARSSLHWQAAQQLLDDLAELDEAQCAEGYALHVGRLSALSVERLDNLLRYWLLRQGAPQPPGAAQLAQLRQQMMHARSDAHPSVELCGLSIERHGGLLVAEPLKYGDPPDFAVGIRWQGEPEIVVPQWQGALLFERSAGPGLCPERLRSHSLLLRPRTGGERLKPDAQRPSRTLKNLFQESAIPAQQRPWLPLVYLDGALVYAAGLGMDAREATVDAGVRLDWSRF